MRDLDPKAFRRLELLYRNICKKYGTLRKAFIGDKVENMDLGIKPSKAYNERDFYGLLNEIGGIPPPYKALFQMVKNANDFVTFEEVRILDEQWTWGNLK